MNQDRYSTSSPTPISRAQAREQLARDLAILIRRRIRRQTCARLSETSPQQHKPR